MVDQNFDPAVHSLDTQSRPAPQALPPRTPAPQQPATEPESPEEPGRYRYVARAVQAAYHIYEETTGHRVTTLPHTSQSAAEEQAEQLNILQVPPR